MLKQYPTVREIIYVLVAITLCVLAILEWARNGVSGLVDSIPLVVGVVVSVMAQTNVKTR